MPDPSLLTDIRIRPIPRTGVVCCSIVHDEMYFIPAYLEHYRSIGASHFVFLDDRSTDDTVEYLTSQPDCTVVGSPYRYFDDVNGDRAVVSWRNTLLSRFCTGRWAILADADEFLAMPPGQVLDDVVRHLEAAGSTGIWGVMLDLYPERIEDMDSAAPEPFTLAAPWHFDGVKHLRVRDAKRPKQLYPGARDRVLRSFGLLSNGTLYQRTRLRLGLRNRLCHRITLSKVPLMRWSKDHVVHGSHRVTPWPVTKDLLAILHCKFTPDLSRKIDYALATRGYVSGSSEYQLLAALRERMENGNGSFLGSVSAPLTSPGAPYRTPAAWVGW